MLNAKIPPIQRIHHKYTFKDEMELVKTSKKKNQERSSRMEEKLLENSQRNQTQ